MNMIELNSNGKKTALLVHPMLANSEMIRTLIASRLGDEYRFFIPDLSGHGSARQYPFTEAAKEADEIHAYLQRSMIFKLDLVWGASLGAAVALALMRYVDIDYESLILDGTPFLKAPKLVTNLIARKMVLKHRKAMKDHELTHQRMTELYGEIGNAMGDELIAIDEESLRYVIHSCAETRYPFLNDEQQKRAHFIFGEKDYNLKDAGRKLPEIYPGAEMKVLPGYAHCEMIGKDPDGYVSLLKSYI